MKTTRIIAALLFFTGIVNLATAQYEASPPPPADEGTPPTGYFEVGFGAAQPIGRFSSEGGTGYGGYALPGTNFNLSFGLPIMHSNFGVAIMYNYAWNAFDIDNYVSNIQISDQNNSYAPLGQDFYTENFILAGLFATIPIQRLSFDFRLMGGVAICGLPEIDYGEEANSVTATQNFEWDTYSSTSTAFATDMGFNLRYRIYRTSIMAGIDYLYSDPMVRTTQYYTDQYGNSTYTHIGGSSPISLISYSIGIGYQFW